ncbi:SHOCT domain-containing protein [Nocardioides rubriscoriae]|uniref:SHOCT domain-containing protein n=1 Tax=Nocardioides rubriscoriae TaxID=642762 RepID=UPI001B874BF2|nr:SHOCT domain-containing protein [Nocardioides rubriscoriae]
MWDDDGHDYGMMNGDGWSAAIVVLLVLLVLVVLAVGAYVVVHLTRQSTHARTAVPPGAAAVPPSSLPAGGGQDPRRVLDLRLARGEVTPEEYDAVRAILERG